MDKKDLLTDHINGGLTEEETQRMKESLAADEDLRSEFNSIRGDQYIVRRTLDGIADHSRKTVSNSVKQQLAQSGTKHSASKTTALLATAAALLFALLVALQSNTNSPGVNEEDPEVSLILSTGDPDVTIYWTIEAE